jgi:hypothetical protein
MVAAHCHNVESILQQTTTAGAVLPDCKHCRSR